MLFGLFKFIHPTGGYLMRLTLHALSCAFSRVTSAFNTTILAALLAATSVVILSSGCMRTNGDDDSTQAKLAANNEKAKAVQAMIAGTYEGKIEITGLAKPLGAKILIYTEQVYDGIDSNGGTKSHPEPRAQLRFDDVMEVDDTIFKVDYKPNSGEVVFSQAQGGDNTSGSGQGGQSGGGQTSVQACPMGPRDPKLQITGTIIGGVFTNGRLTGTALDGRFEMNRTNSESAVPVRDQSTRLAKAFVNLSGTYKGRVAAGATPLNAQITLRTEQVTLSTGLTCPVLVAYFRFSEAVGYLNDTSFSVTYRQSTGDLLMTYSANTSPRSCKIGDADTGTKISARLDGDSIRGSMTGSSGDYGAITLKRASMETAIVDDQADRLRKAYTPLAGTYGGRFVGVPGSNEEFPVKLVISLISVPNGGFGTCPILKGQYSRPEMNEPSVGMIGLDVTYNPRSSSVEMHNSFPSTGGQPGHGEISILGPWTPIGIDQAKMTWWNRIGTVSLTRCQGPQVDRNGTCLN